MAFQRGGNKKNRRSRGRRKPRVPSKTISIRRVAKVYAGGRRLNFSAMVVCGDKKGSVGVALGKGSDPRSAIEKATRKAQKNMVKIKLVGDTIPHSVRHKHKAAKIIMRPAKPGTGVIAGPAGRALTELAGIENVYVKQLGSNDLISNTYCVFEALQKLRAKRVIENMDKMKERIKMKRETDAEERKKRRKKGNKGYKKSRGSKGSKSQKSGKNQQKNSSQNKPKSRAKAKTSKSVKKSSSKKNNSKNKAVETSNKKK